MRNRTPDCLYRRSAASIAAWASTHEPLLTALKWAEDAGDTGVTNALSSLSEIRRARSSFELVETLAEGEGRDLDSYLLDEMTVDQVDLLRSALGVDRLADVIGIRP